MWTTKSGEVHEEIHHNKKNKVRRAATHKDKYGHRLNICPSVLCAISRLHGNN